MFLRLFATAAAYPLIKCLIDNRASYNMGMKAYLALSLADTAGMYYNFMMQLYAKCVFMMAYLYIMYADTPRQFKADFAYKFTQSEGVYYIVDAVMVDGNDSSGSSDNSNDSSNTINIQNQLKVFLALYPHNTIELKQYLQQYCINYSITTPVIQIKYICASGLYSLTIDITRERNLSIDDDLMFGDIVIDPQQSKQIQSFAN